MKGVNYISKKEDKNILLVMIAFKEIINRQYLKYDYLVDDTDICLVPYVFTVAIY